MTFKSKVDWWVPVVVIFSVACCFVGPMFDGDYWWGVGLGCAVLAIELFIFTSVKYKIEGNRLGVRSFYRWTWYPIDKIAVVKRQRSVLSAPALSFDRLAIKFTDKSILKSFMPLEISPKDPASFISRLKQINPNINIHLHN